MTAGRPDKPSAEWRALQRSARGWWLLRAVVWGGIPVLGTGWALATWGARAGWWPLLAAGLAALLLAVAAVAAGWWWRRNQPNPALNADLAAALDWRAGVAGSAGAAARVWSGVGRGARDPWWLGMAAAVEFALLLNTAPLWLPPALTLVGQDWSHTLRVQEPVVRIVDLSLRDWAGRERRLERSDGYLRVDEGDEVRLRLEATRPATAVAMLREGQRTEWLPLSPEGRAELRFTAERPFSYRFASTRWGVSRTEALPRRVEVRPDNPPEPRWVRRPLASAASGEWIRFEWTARDDRAVTAVVLEARVDGRSEWIRLWEADEAVTSQVGPAGATVDPAELPPGTQAVLTLLAWDRRSGDGRVGRSESLTVELESPEAEHQRLIEALAAHLKDGVHRLGDTWEVPREQASSRAHWEALARTARELADMAGGLVLRGLDTEAALARVAELWAAGGRETAAREALPKARDAVWELDELIGREEAARLEWGQDQLISRLEQLQDGLGDLDDADLQRLMRQIEREMAALADAMRSERPRLADELLQSEALQPEAAEARRDRMQEAREALARGDRDAARQALESLLEDMRQARESLRSVARDQLGDVQAAEQRAAEQARRLRELSEQEAALAESQRAHAEARQELAEESRRFASRMGQRSGNQAPIPRPALEQALRGGDSEAARQLLRENPETDRRQAGELARRWSESNRAAEALADRQAEIAGQTQAVRIEMGEGEDGSAVGRQLVEQAEQHMADGQSAALQGDTGEAAQQAQQAARALAEAARRSSEQAAQAGQLAAAPSFRRPSQPGGRQGEGERGGPQRHAEPFEAPTPEAGDGSRAEVLRGFRGGLPEPGREVNERYLDRLLH